jgi:hypothetical protein
MQSYARSRDLVLGQGRQARPERAKPLLRAPFQPAQSSQQLGSLTTANLVTHA